MTMQLQYKQINQTLENHSDVSFSSLGDGNPVVYNSGTFENVSNLNLLNGNITKTDDTTLTLLSGKTDASDAIAYILNTQSLANENAQIIEFQNNSVGKARIYQDGKLETESVISQIATSGINVFNADSNYNYTQHIKALLQQLEVDPSPLEERMGQHYFNIYSREGVVNTGFSFESMTDTLPEDQMTTAREAVVRGLYNGAKNVASQYFESNVGQANPRAYLRFRANDYHLYETTVRKNNVPLLFDISTESPTDLTALAYINGINKLMYRNVFAADNGSGSDHGYFWTLKEPENTFELMDTLDEPNYPTVWGKFHYKGTSEEAVILNKHSSHPKMMLVGQTDVEPLVDNFANNSIDDRWEDNEEKTWYEWYLEKWIAMGAGNEWDYEHSTTTFTATGRLDGIVDGDQIQTQTVTFTVTDDTNVPNSVVVSGGSGDVDGNVFKKIHRSSYGPYSQAYSWYSIAEEDNVLKFKEVDTRTGMKGLRTKKTFDQIGNAETYVEAHMQVYVARVSNGTIVGIHFDDNNYISIGDIRSFGTSNQLISIKEHGTALVPYDGGRWVLGKWYQWPEINKMKKYKVIVHTDKRIQMLVTNSDNITFDAYGTGIYYSPSGAWTITESGGDYFFNKANMFASGLVNDVVSVGTYQEQQWNVLEVINDNQARIDAIATDSGTDQIRLHRHWKFQGDMTTPPSAFAMNGGDKGYIPHVGYCDYFKATDGTTTVEDNFSSGPLDTVNFYGEDEMGSSCSCSDQSNYWYYPTIELDSNKERGVLNYTNLKVQNNRCDFNKYQQVLFENTNLNTFVYDNDTGWVTFSTANGANDFSGLYLWPTYDNFMADSRLQTQGNSGALVGIDAGNNKIQRGSGLYNYRFENTSNVGWDYNPADGWVDYKSDVSGSWGSISEDFDRWMDENRIQHHIYEKSTSRGSGYGSVRIDTGLSIDTDHGSGEITHDDEGSILNGGQSFSNETPTDPSHGAVYMDSAGCSYAPDSSGKCLRHVTPVDKDGDDNGEIIIKKNFSINYNLGLPADPGFGNGFFLAFDTTGKNLLFAWIWVGLGASKPSYVYCRSVANVSNSTSYEQLDDAFFEDGKEYELKLIFKPGEETYGKAYVYLDDVLIIEKTLTHDINPGDNHPTHGPFAYHYYNYQGERVNVHQYYASPYVTEPKYTLKNALGFSFSNQDKSEYTLNDGGAGNAWVDYNTQVDLSGVSVGDHILDTGLDDYPILEVDQTRGSGKGGVRIATASGFDDSSVSITDHGSILKDDSLQLALMDGSYTPKDDNSYADKYYLLADDGSDTKLLTCDLNDADNAIESNKTIGSSLGTPRSISVDGGYAFVTTNTYAYRWDIKNDTVELFSSGFTTPNLIKVHEDKVYIYDDDSGVHTLYAYDKFTSQKLWEYPCESNCIDAKEIMVTSQDIFIICETALGKVKQFLNR